MAAVHCVSVVNRENTMPSFLTRSNQQGKIGWILLWLLGVPIPVLLVLFLIRGCT